MRTDSTLALCLALAAALGQSAPSQQPESPVPCSGAATTALAYGQHTTGCSVSPATNLDRFVFTGAIGDQVRLRVVGHTRDFDPRLDLYDPSGNLLASPLCGSAWNSTCSFEHIEMLAAAGTFTVIVSDSGTDNVGDYTLQIERIPPITQAPGLASGETLSDVLSPATDIDFFAFEGAANALVQFTLQGLTRDLDPVVEIYEVRTGQTIDTQSCSSAWNSTCSINFQATLPTTGPYLLLVHEGGIDNTGSYHVSMTCIVGACPSPAVRLSAAPATLEAAKGGAQTFTLQAGPAFAGRSYLLLGSLNGFVPGFPFGGIRVPLNFEPAYFPFSIANANGPALTNTLGRLDASGNATASLNLPALPASLAGTVLHHAFLVFDSQGLHVASNPVALTLQ